MGLFGDKKGETKGGKAVHPDVALVERRYLDAWHLKRSLMGEWFVNLAFYRGLQYVTWDENNRSLDSDLIPEWKIQCISNYIMPTTLTLAGLLVSSDPPYGAVPAHSSASSERAARAGTAYLQHAWEHNLLYRKVLLARMWALICGRGFLQVYWDPDDGADVEVLDLEGMAAQEADPDLNEGPGVKDLPFTQMKRGRVKIEVGSPFSTHLDPLALSATEAKWVLFTSQAHCPDLQAQYGEIAAGIKPGVEHVAKDYERRLLYDFGRYNYPSADVSDIVTVKEHYESPSDAHPEGRYMVVAGGVLLHSGPHPYGGKHPIVEFGGIPSMGGYWDEALVTQMRPLQIECNRARSRHTEAGLLMANSKWFVWANSGLLQNSMDSEPGEIVEVEDAAPSFPQRSDPPPVGQHWMQVMQVAQADMDNISGLNDASWGRATEHTSGRALAIAQEGTMTRQSLLLSDQDKAITHLGRMLLDRAKQYYDEDRIIRIMGPDGEPLVHTFSSREAGECMDVRIESRSGFPYSRIAKMEFVLEAWKLNLIVNKDGQRDPAKAAKLLEFGGMNALFSGGDVADKRHAENENLKFLSGEADQVVVESFDNHYMHSEVLRQLLVSEDGRDLKAEDPESWQAAMQHRDLHIAMIAQAENPQGMELSRPPVGAGSEGSAPGAAPPVREVAGQPGVQGEGSGAPGVSPVLPS